MSIQMRATAVLRFAAAILMLAGSAQAQDCAPTDTPGPQIGRYYSYMTSQRRGPDEAFETTTIGYVVIVGRSERGGQISCSYEIVNFAPRLVAITETNADRLEVVRRMDFDRDGVFEPVVELTDEQIRCIGPDGDCPDGAPTPIRRCEDGALVIETEVPPRSSQNPPRRYTTRTRFRDDGVMLSQSIVLEGEFETFTRLIGESEWTGPSCLDALKPSGDR